MSNITKADELPIPPCACKGDTSVEIARVWLVDGRLHASLQLGIWGMLSDRDQENAWGKVFADITSIVSSAVSQDMKSTTSGECCRNIIKFYLAELENNIGQEFTGNFV